MTVALVGVCGWALTMIAWGQAPPVPEPEPFTPVASQATVSRQLQHHLDQIGRLLPLRDTTEHRQELVDAGELLAELANVASRYPHSASRIALATELRDQALAFTRSAKNRATATPAELTRLHQHLLRITRAWQVAE